MSEFKNYNLLYNKFKGDNPDLIEINFQEFRYAVQHYSYYELFKVFMPKIHFDSSSPLNFKTIIDLYLLQRDLKDILLKYVLRFEALFKEVLGHELGAQYGANVLTIFSRENLVHSNVNYKDKEINFYKKLLREERKKPTAIYRKKNGSVPPWIFTRNLTMAQLNTLFHITRGQKNVIAQILYGLDDNIFIDATTENFFAYSTELILQYRNKLAHGSNIIDFPIIKSNFLTYNTFKIFVNDQYNNEDFDAKQIDHGTFKMLIICLCMLISKRERKLFIDELNAFIEETISSHHDNSMINYLSFFSLTPNFISDLKAIPGIMELP